MLNLPSPPPNYEALAAAVDFADHDAYVHVGQGTDDVLRYLTRVDGEDRYYFFVQTQNETILGVTARHLRAARERFPGDRVVEIPPDCSIPGVIGGLLDDASVVAVPETTPVGVATDLKSVASVDVVPEPDEVWCVKSAEERRLLAHLADGVQFGIARTERVLSEAVPEDSRLIWEGEPLSTERLRREIQKALAACGLSDRGNVVIGAGPSCTDLHFTGDDTICPNETVLVDLGPRGPFGYYGDIARTFVPGTPSDWVREAYRVVEEALDAGLDTVATGAGVTTGELYGSMAAVIESYGYETGVAETRDDVVGLTHGTGHGIGVRLHEKPFQTPGGDRKLAAGNVLTIEPGVYDPGRGGVRLEDVVVIEEDGFENLIDYPTEIDPTRRERDRPSIE